MKDLKSFHRALENNLFFEAHEILETPWKKLKNTDINTANGLKGLINAATSLHHLKIGKIQAHKKTWETYEKYLHLLDDSLFDETKALLLEKKTTLTSDKLS